MQKPPRGPIHMFSCREIKGKFKGFENIIHPSIGPYPAGKMGMNFNYTDVMINWKILKQLMYRSIK